MSRWETNRKLIATEFVLHLPDRREFFGLNETAQIIWRGLEQKKSILEIVKEVQKRCGGTRKVVERDVKHFVELLSKKKLITRK